MNLKVAWIQSLSLGLFVISLVACSSGTYDLEYALESRSPSTLSQDWNKRLSEGFHAIDTITNLPSWVKNTQGDCRQEYWNLKSAFAVLNLNWQLPYAELRDLDSRLKAWESVVQNLLAIDRAQQGNQSLAVLFPEAISDTVILPETFPIPETNHQLSLALCAGEYESAQVALLALQDKQVIDISCSDFSGPGQIAATILDLHLVKAWYQAGKAVLEPFGLKTLVPELLLKDDQLVKVDYRTKQNFVRSTGTDGSISYLDATGNDPKALDLLRPIDSKSLQPFNITAKQNRQIWLTVHAPEDAVPGMYTTEITIKVKDSQDIIVPFTMQIYPFELAESPLRYSIYYRSFLDQKGSISSEAKSEEQLLAELRDLKAHGVLYPTTYQGLSEPLNRTLELRAEAGLPAGTLYSLGMGSGIITDPIELAAFQEKVRAFRKAIAPYGYQELYLYGIDEAVGEKLTQERATWLAIKEAGAKMFVACFEGAYNQIGDVLDLAVVALKPSKSEAEKYHSQGNQIFCYLYPQGGEETPASYRRNYGLTLYLAGYDGAMTYAYQHGFGHVWNDFDGWPWRDHNFAYPTVDGIIGTRQWEGFREAVDDVRYIATLKIAIEKASSTMPELAKQASYWLDHIDPDYQPIALRRALVDWILRLQLK